MSQLRDRGATLRLEEGTVSDSMLGGGGGGAQDTFSYNFIFLKILPAPPAPQSLQLWCLF